MFNPFHRSTVHYPTIREALAISGVQSATDPAGLTVLERSGSYSGRRVNFFRAFDPTSASARATPVQAFKDLDTRQDLVLGSGHVEIEGLVMVNKRPEQERVTPARAPADRDLHTDDERFVFWDTGAAAAYEALLSEPAAVWLHAQ